MVKDDEIQMRRIALKHPKLVGFTLEEMGFNWKRVNSVLSKWESKGWYNWGTSIRGGWLTEEGIKEFKKLEALL